VSGAVLFLVALAAVGFGALAILVIRHQRKLAAERHAAYLRLAERYGLRYRSDRASRLDELFPAFGCFREGHSRRANHLLDGRMRTPGGIEMEVFAGEWRFLITRSNGKTTTTTEHRFGFVLLGPSLGAWPGLRVRAENLFDRIAGAIGWDDIDFESVEFSKRFHVTSVDKRFAYDLLDPTMIELFLAGPAIPQVDLADTHACFRFGRSTPLEPAALEALLGWGSHFLDRIPRMVRAGLAEGRYVGGIR